MVSILFSENRKAELWQNNKSYYANLLSACTGMRLREVLGLQYQDVNNNIVTVNKQYSPKYGLTPTKTKTVRSIPIPPSISSAFVSMEHTSEEDFIFASANNPRIPIHGTSCSYALRGALKRMGMRADEIKEKNISFHSWRHYFNTIMRSNNITDSKLQKMTGHKSAQMTDYYTHYEIEDLKEIAEIQAKIVPGSI
ncbi:hypothetical protein DV872_06015 [Oceanispirochaeta sp. M1]|nr:hypothetical protein DV872_06015 [Oceanispirochaeta sp. M1]